MQNIPEKIFVAGIHTDAGKTFISALLMLGLDADYWKPVQAGTEPTTDTLSVQELTGLPSSRFHPEAYQLEFPASPHAAAAREGIRIDESKLSPPPHTRPLLIEGAGGLMVPLREDLLFVDWLAQKAWPTILVIPTYLGCINHSLLSLEALRKREIPLMGIVFNDGGRPESESVIEKYAEAPVLARVPQIASPSPAILKQCFDQHFSLPL